MANSTFTLPKATGVALTTLGTKVSWCWETEAGTRPTENYAIIYDCTKSLPLGGSPDKIETTPLNAKVYKTNVTGLQDLGDTTIECNWTQSVIDMHAAWLEFASTAKSKKLSLWLCIDLEGLAKSFFVPVFPASRSIEALEPNTAPKYVINLDVLGEMVEASDPSYANDESVTDTMAWTGDLSTGSISIAKKTGSS